MEPFDAGDAVKRYLAGESTCQIAKSLGVTLSKVEWQINKRGLRRGSSESARRRHATPAIDESAVAARYAAGETAQSIALNLGCSINVIQRIAKLYDIPVRSLAETKRAWYAKSTKEQRLALTQAAHDATRGRSRSNEDLCKIAVGCEKGIGKRIGPDEATMIGYLVATGCEVVPQKAVGRYNLDIALTESSIAVEMFGGGWHAQGALATNHRKRFDYLINNGWLPIIVWTVPLYPLSVAAHDYIVAIHKARCRGETMRSEEHVIRGDGHGGPISEGYPEGIPVVPCYKSCNKLRSNYASSWK